MSRLRWVLAAYDWLARLHFALFALGGVGALVAAVSLATEFPTISIVFGTLGLTGIGLGIVGWQASKRQSATVSTPIGVAEQLAARRPRGELAPQWLPDVNDLGTLRLTNRDLDGCYRRALHAARQSLAPDASIRFDHMQFGGADHWVVFRASSRTANKWGEIHVDELGAGISPQEVKGWTEEQWSIQLPARPWQDDKSWRELVKAIWYRTRPAPIQIELRAEWRVIDHQDEWSLWYACIVTHEDGPRRCFGFHNGQMEEFSW